MNIAVIYGGESTEHDVSVVTAVQLIKNISNKNIIIPIYITSNGKMYEVEDYDNVDRYKTMSLKKEVSFIQNSMYLHKKTAFAKYKRYKKIDFCYIAMHGKKGEDGVVASVLEMSHIPYSSSDILGSSVCLDKAVFKNVMFGLGVNIVPYVNVLKSEYDIDPVGVGETIEKQLSYPVIIKPSSLGSSIGITIASSREDLDHAINESFAYDNMVVVEKYVDIETEVNIALFRYNDEMIFSSFEKPKSEDEILSFRDKYIRSNIDRELLDSVGDRLDSKIKDISERVYTFLRLRGVVRFDYIVDKSGILYLNELNTIPGSMAHYLYKDRGIDYSELMQMICRQGIVDYKDKKRLITTFGSGVLNKLNGIKFNK